MATIASHKDKWLHNREFLQTIDLEFPDWMTVAIFYASVHAVETLFFHDRTRVHGSHTARNQTLKSITRYQNIWKNYRPLFDAARTARYEVVGATWIPVEDVKKKLVTHLYALETGVLKLIGSKETLEPIW